MNELCIRCGKETKYDVSAPVNMRKYYIEGSGQLCETCYFTFYPVPGPLRSDLGGEERPTEQKEIIPSTL